MSDPDRRSAALAALADVADLAASTTRHCPLVGGVLAVADRSGLLAASAFGESDRERSTPMSVSRRFEIGSISKLFTSLAVNRLVDAGRLALSDAVGDFVPWASLDAATSALTLEQLLTHTSGICMGADTLADDAGEIWNSRHVAVASATPPRFHYSNLGYLLLGEVVRAVEGRRVNDVVQEHFLVPLGMTDARAEVAFDDRATLAVGYWPARPDRPWVPGDPVAPATFLETDSASGNVAASASDMARLVAALLAAHDDDPVRDRDGAAVISRATFERVTTTLAPSGEPTYTPAGILPVTESRYGMGLNVERVGDHLCVTHGGGMVGYSTFMLVDCTAGVGVVALTNANGDTLASHLLARATHTAVLARLSGAPVPSLPDLDPTLRAAFPGEGDFVDDDGASLAVLRDPAAATLRVRHGDAEGTVFRFATGRCATDHPALRRYHLDWHEGPAAECWTYGERTFRRVGANAPARTRGDARSPLVGHYRSYSPWYPEFRVVQRDERLWLVAPGGVEAPDAELELVAVSPGTYRVGADPWLPERLVVGTERDGEVVALERDGLRYSRVFSA